MNWLYRLDYKYGRRALPNLMLYIVIGQFVVFAVNLFYPALGLSSLIALNRDMIFQGQVWRIVTFLFEPMNSSPLWILISMYFYWFIGSSLENEWGSFKFDFYYLAGAFMTVVFALITGSGINMYLNLSLFVAFAILWPDQEFLVFFVIPVKAKYLALLDVIPMILGVVTGSWSVRGSIFASVIMLFIFFGGDFLRRIKNQRAYQQTRRNFRSQMNDWERNQKNF